MKTLVARSLQTSLLLLLCCNTTNSQVAAQEQPQPSVWQNIESLFKPPAPFENNYGNWRSLLKFADGSEVKTPEDWSRRRKEIYDYWMTTMGKWPEIIQKPEVTVLSESVREGISQSKVRIAIGPQGQTGDGWLLVPPSKKPLPAVLVVFYEPETSIGLLADKPHRDFAWQLAKRGFITLSLGTPGGDARLPDIRNAECQPLSYHAYVAANCWHALANMPQVDAKRIGIVGHSYGGKWSMFGGALWDKFAAVATSDPGIVFDDTRSNINYWEPWYLGLDRSRPKRKSGLPTAENPAAGAYVTLRESGHDLIELHALICPRPFFVSGGSEDPAERWLALNHSIAVNNILGVKHRVGMSNRPDHSPNENSNAALCDFFVHFLMQSESSATK